MKSRTVLLIFSILLMYLALTVYIGWNGFVFWNAGVTETADWAYWTVYAFLAYGYLGAMLLRRVLPYRLYTTIKLIGSYGLAVLMYSLLTLPLADIVYALLRWGGVEAETAVQAIGSVELLLLGAILAIGSRNAWSPVVRRYDIRVGKQAGTGSRKELRIAVASDLHLGTIVGKRHIRRLLEKVEAIRPDLILLPGDVLDDSIDPFIREKMADVMRDLKAPLGVYASLGNHEYIGGHIDEYVERMKAIGIEVLVDRVVKLEGSFYVAGRKDAAVARFSPDGRLTVDELLAEADKSLPIVLLDHQPRKLGEAAEAGVDLMLSGHTHRGQLMPGHLITRRIFELDWGYMRKGAMHAIVSCGFGSWGPPLRIGSRSELLDIHIVFGDE